MNRKKLLKISFCFISEPRKYTQRKKYELVFDSVIFFNHICYLQIRLRNGYHLQGFKYCRHGSILY